LRQRAANGEAGKCCEDVASVQVGLP
jgi:hypothetical protein